MNGSSRLLFAKEGKLVKSQLVILNLLLYTTIALSQEVIFSSSKNGLEVHRNKGIGIVINITDEAKKVRLTKTRLQTKCELRFRQAGINIATKGFIINPIFLYVDVTVYQLAFAVRLEFKRPMQFTVGNVEYRQLRAATWTDGAVGIHGNDPELIVGSVDQRLDMFLNDFLEANPKE